MIVTPLDSAVLDSKEQYIFYHKMVDFALKELVRAMEHNALCTEQEMAVFKQYCDLLLYSIEAMRVKYMYDDEDNMKVDLTDSGFPNYIEFRYLYNDLALRTGYLEKLPPIETLQEQFLDTLMRKKRPVKKNKLFQAASIAYYTSVEQKYIFNRFVQGKILEAPKGSKGDYVASWSFYDVSNNRPFVCFMYFDFEGRKVESYKDKIYDALKAVADRDMALDTMSYAIDRKLDDVLPRHVKRIDLGPLHNIFAKDENQITHAILEGIGKKEIPHKAFAISLRVDETISGGEFTEGSFFSKQTLQKWDKPFRKDYVFAPHRIIQLLYNKTPEVMNNLAKAPIQVDGFKIE